MHFVRKKAKILLRRKSDFQAPFFGKKMLEELRRHGEQNLARHSNDPLLVEVWAISKWVPRLSRRPLLYLQKEKPLEQGRVLEPDLRPISPDK